MFANTRLLSPVIIDGQTRAYPGTSEYQSWWKEERRRCLEGYTTAGISITGIHYFYLNWWKIRGLDHKTNRKSLINPRFLDMDYEYFWALDKAMKAGKNMCVGKARQKGFSEKHSGIAGWNFTFFPSSQSVITAAEDKYNQNTMRMCLRGLNQLSGTEFFKRKSPDRPEYIQAKYMVKDNATGKQYWKGSYSEVYSITAFANTEALSGLSPDLVIMEEVGIWEKAREVFRFVDPMLHAEGKKSGICVMVGTGGSMSGGMDALKEFFMSPESFGIMDYPYWTDLTSYDDEPVIGYDTNDLRRTGFFVPAWKFRIVDEDGNSLKEESLIDIEKAREAARKSKESNGYYTNITQSPVTIDEMFMSSSANRFNRDYLHSQAARIMRSRELSSLAQHGDLKWVMDGQGRATSVEWVPDKEGCAERGPVIIFEHPQKNEQDVPYRNLYYGGTDSYDRPEAVDSKSLLSCSILKGVLDINSTSHMFVARYTARPKLPETAYEYTAKLCMYYGCLNLIEYSNILIFKWYKDNGFEYMLKERPMLVYENVKNSKMNNRYGVDPSTREHWLNIYKDYIEEYSERMMDVEQVNMALKWRDDDKKYNCDITISSSLAVTHWKDEMKIQATPVIEETFGFMRYRMINGSLQMAFENSPN